MKKLWPMMWTITSTGCSLCCWPMPWLGCAGVTGAPDAAQELNLGADTTKFVNVPLDMIYKY